MPQTTSIQYFFNMPYSSMNSYHTGLGVRTFGTDTITRQAKPSWVSRIQALMSHIRRTCQEIRDIKNPLRSRRPKLINKVYLRPPGPNHDSNRGRLQDKC